MMRKSVFDTFSHASVWHKPPRHLQIRNEELIGRFLEVFLQKRGMTFVLWILVSSTSMSNIVKAECVPLPDCASI
jgi:hypothetical protein